MKRTVLALLLAGCYARGPVGPYVRSMSRSGNLLVIERCTIVLEGDDVLRYGACTTQQLPLSGAR
jgi:hypothetical protein